MRDGPRQSDRRRFLNWFLGTSIGAMVASAVYPVTRFLSPPRVPEAETHEVEAGYTNDPELVDKSFKIVQFGQEPLILIHVGGDDYRAFTATCTHLDCIVDYRLDKRLVWCWCHDGVYDLNGKNIGGPPPRPLTPFTVELVRQEGGGPSQIVIRKT